MRITCKVANIFHGNGKKPPLVEPADKGIAS